ncbi:MAG: aspartate aminotransferase family protein [Coriobacteriia bacterium]|nr:aspartate aminotransferase family protein [Coriobacteriia bacterium]
MGVKATAAFGLDAKYVMQTYARKPILFVSGKGMRLFDDEGAEYLDFVSGIGAVNLGHSHPAVCEAIARQGKRLTHVSNLYYVEHRAELAEELSGLFDGGTRRVFFSNSGTEANEGAIKLARRFAQDRHPGAFKVVTAERSFHGRTLATLAATGQAAKQERFLPLPEGFSHVPLNDIDALDAALDETVAALLLEVVQGEGGVFPANAGYLSAAEQLCRERGILLMIDEVQTGFFRTGPAFAHQAFGLMPDVVTVAKAMANGLPVGAVIACEEVAEAFMPGDHGSTFGGGPLVCAAARATLRALSDEQCGRNALSAGAYLQARLGELMQGFPLISDVRGAGLMVGCSLTEPVAAEVVGMLLRRGLLVNNIGANIIRFLPPLLCKTAEVDTLCANLEEVLVEVCA